MEYSGITQEQLTALSEADENLTPEQRIKALEVWMATIVPLLMGYVSKDGDAVPGAIRRIGSLEKWVKIGVVGGGVMSFISTFGLADPLKHILSALLQ